MCNCDNFKAPQYIENSGSVSGHLKGIMSFLWRLCFSKDYIWREWVHWNRRLSQCFNCECVIWYCCRGILFQTFKQHFARRNIFVSCRHPREFYSRLASCLRFYSCVTYQYFPPSSVMIRCVISIGTGTAHLAAIIVFSNSATIYSFSARWHV